MLADSQIYAVVPAMDLARAKQFYSEKLGLEPEKEDGQELVYQCGNGSRLQVYKSGFAGTAQNTAMGWDVDDVDKTVADLRAKGVVFEEYDMPGLKTVNGIASMGDMKAAWFKDSEGNILCVSHGAAG